MSASISYGGTVITLAPEQPAKKEVNLQPERDTIGGYRRRQLLWRKYQYTMTLEPLTTAQYDAIRDLWVNAREAGSWLTFSWPEWWPETASGVLVSCDLGDQTNVYASYVTTKLTLTEVNPR